MNKEVSTSNLGVSTSTLPFELKATNNETDFNHYLEAKSAHTDVDQTSAEVDTIKWFMNDVTVTNENKGLHPGSHGTFSFNLYPKHSENMTIKFSIETSAYKYVVDSSGERVKDADNYDTIVQIAANQPAAKYVSGHIVFFENYDSVTGYYSKRIGNYFLYDTSAHSADAQTDDDGKTFYPITIHWIWANTFGQFVLDKGDVDLRDAALFSTSQATYTPVGSNTAITPRNEMIQYIKTDSGSYFFDSLNTSSASLDTMLSSPANIKSYIIPLSNGYSSTYSTSNTGDLNLKWCNHNSNENKPYTDPNCTCRATFSPNGSKYTSNLKCVTNEFTDVMVRTYLAGAYYQITDDLILPAKFAGLGAGNEGRYAFRGVIVGKQDAYNKLDGTEGTETRYPCITNKSANPLILTSNGCVVKNVIVQVNDLS